MRKRLLILLLCIGMSLTCFDAVADGDETASSDDIANTAASPLAGDANGDGKVSASDASLVLRYCVGLGNSGLSVGDQIRADVNRDYTVDASDAAAILRHAAGLSTLKALEALDAALYDNLLKQNTVGDMTEWIAYFIQRLPAGDRRSVLFAGAVYMGTPYGTKSGQLDCSAFVKAAFKDAGIATGDNGVYPGKSSEKTLSWFRNNHPEQLHETDRYSSSDWKPGDVLIYVDTNGKATHLALFVGEIGGTAYVMESRSNKVDGVRLGVIMSSYVTSDGNESDLRYYVNPLG